MIRNKKTGIIIILIILILAIMSIATYAWFTWSSTNNTELTLTIGQLADVTFNTGDGINISNIGPVLNYLNDGEVAAFSIKNKSEAELLTNINLNITNLPEELKEESFKFILLSSTDNIHFNEVTSGSFVDKSIGVLSLISEEPTSVGTTYYKFIIYIDGNMENPTDMMGKSFDGKLEVTVGKISNGAEYIESLLASNLTTMNNDDPDGNVRYMGKNPNNYILFNNELWRIIGVFNIKSSVSGSTQKRLKIVRTESLGDTPWDLKNTNNWSTSSIQTYLNSTYYNTLTIETQNLIENSYWNLGGSSITNTASAFYQSERGTTVYEGHPTYWIGKIGLMYPSDYLYATSGGTTISKQTCLSNELDWSNLSDCYNNDYLYNANLYYYWTLTPHNNDPYNVICVKTTGYLSNVLAYSPYSVLPVLYLKSTVEITGGDGTSENPYTLS